MKARVKWLDHMTFVAESGSGHTIVMDGAAESGGRNLASRPMETVLMGMGGCAAYDVVTILRKARQNVDNCEVHLSAERADSIPAVFTKIHLHFVVDGDNLGHKHVERAVTLSAEKYCSVSKMLSSTATITHSFQLGAEPNVLDDTP